MLNGLSCTHVKYSNAISHFMCVCAVCRNVQGPVPACLLHIPAAGGGWCRLGVDVSVGRSDGGEVGARGIVGDPLPCIFSGWFSFGSGSINPATPRCRGQTIYLQGYTGWWWCSCCGDAHYSK